MAYKHSAESIKETNNKKFVSNEQIESWDRLQEQIEEVNSQLEQKVNKGDKIQVSQIDKNNGKIDQTYLSEELLQQMTGDTPINAVPADNSLSTNKYIDNSVTGEKVNFLTSSGNLVNPDLLTTGFINSSNGSISENASGGTVYVTTDYIPILSGVSYYTSRYRKLLCYDTSKNPLSNTYVDGGEAGLLTFENDGYIRFSYWSSDIGQDCIFIKSDTTDVVYKEFGYELNEKISKISADKIASVDGNVILPNSIKSDKLTIVSPGINLFDNTKFEMGFLGESTGIINSNSATGIQYITSDFIEIEAGEQYEVTSHRKLCVFDENKNFLLGYDVELTDGAKTYTFDEGVYIRFSTTYSSLNEAMICKGNLPEVYERYGNIIRSGSDLAGIDGSSILVNSLTKESTDFIFMGNYFNPYSEDIIEDAVVTGIDNAAWSVPGLYDASGYIDIPTTGYYVFHNVRNIYVYNSNGKVLRSNQECVQGESYVEYLTRGFKVRITMFHNLRYKSTYIQLGKELNTNYKSYGYILSEDISTIVKSDDVISLNGEKIENSSIYAEKCEFIKLSKNLYNKDTVTHDVYINSDGSYSSYEGYRTSAHIPIKANTDYYITRCRKLAVFDNVGKAISEYFIDNSNNGGALVNIPFDGSIRISLGRDYWEVGQVEEGSEPTEYEPYGITIPKLLLDSNENTVVTSNIHVIKLDNVDRIGAIGDSYTESHYTLKGKSYLSKLSLFSDYNWENFAQSGDTYRGNLNRIRTGSPIYHSTLSWKDYKPTHALLISYTNDLKYMDTEQYTNDLRAVVETVKGLGAIPILATEYHCNFGRGIQNAILGVANEYGLDVINILPKAMALRGTDYKPFWGGSHPGTRTNHILCDPLETYFKKLPRPFQSIKIFRKRDSVEVSSLDSLLFNTNIERAKKFKEIMIGHSAINNSNEYDNCTTSKNSKVTSEYLKLLNNENVEFENYALIDAILPATSKDIDYIDLTLSNTNVEVYVKDVMKEPYPSPSFYQRFDFEGTPNFVVGDTYKSNDSKFGEQVFTVREVQDGTVLMYPCKQLSSEDGVLTKVSGSGDDAIPYFYTAVGFASDYPQGKLNVGHWVKVDKVDNNYRVTKELLNTSMDYDKVSFLIVKDGIFSLSKIEVSFQGDITKSRKTLQRTTINSLPNSATQLLAEQFVGNTEQLNRWTKVGTLNPYVPIDSVLPKDCVGCVDVTQDDKLTQTITVDSFVGEDRKAIVRVWARYFPKVFDKDTMVYPNDSEITEDTFDYAELNISTKIQGKEYKLSDLVGLGWKEVEFEIFIPSEITSIDFTIWSNDKPIQISKASIYMV